MTVILALVLACASPQPTILDTTHGRTNVVFLTIDTLRADHLGAYGYDVPTSPNLDALAASGVRVEHQWSTCSWTRPAVGSLLTGHYAREIGLYEEQFDRLPDDVTPVEAAHQPILECRYFARRRVGGKDDLLPALIKRVERVE